MPHVLRTPDNRLHTPLSDADLLALVEEYAGRDVRLAVEEMVAEMDDLRDAVADNAREIAYLSRMLGDKE